MVEVVIKGEAKEIAALVLELQSRQQNKSTTEELCQTIRGRSRGLYMVIENQLK